MKRIIISLLCALVCAGALHAQNPQVDVIADYDRTGSNHYAYPIPHDQPVPTLTNAPAGYRPFLIEHYGRHGSRWLTRSSGYTKPLRTLERAQQAGQLTPVGERLLKDLRHVWLYAENRAGELSDVGAEQHQGIAQRMVQNFPTVFHDDSWIDARSTVVLRCILSMQNETMTLRAANPQMRITTDASYHDMWYMGWGYGEDTLANHIRKDIDLVTEDLYRRHISPDRFVNMLFTDTTGLNMDTDHAIKLMSDVFAIAGSLQGHHVFDGWSMYHYFSNAEIFELWRLRNIYWYTHWANSPLNGNRMPFVERALLRNMVESADCAIAQGRRGADLRFGHETCLLPLACLMELDSVNLSTDDLDNLHLHWQDYNIFPKACNIQMVFYEPMHGQKDILVKVLLNEHEATLPVQTVEGPYCRWDDLRDYYLRKLATPIDWN
ncbi:MAG: histidine-type phosphatase [Muribaculaceae bacterium]|nr:histidine-type phosphatase [Muribaculaceae bacterium]